MLNDSSKIKAELTYDELLLEAQKKLYKSTRRSIRFFAELTVILAVSLIVFFLLLLYGIPIGPIGSVRNIILWLLILVMLFCVLGQLSSIKKLGTYVYYYKGDLRRIQEKLTYSNIYVSVPKEDENKYNNKIKLIKDSLKNK